jgi:hypothetical protein
MGSAGAATGAETKMPARIISGGHSYNSLQFHPRHTGVNRELQALF